MMLISRRIDVLLVLLSLLVTNVKPSNYPYPVFPAKYPQTPSKYPQTPSTPPASSVSAPIPPNSTTNKTTELDAKRKPNKPGVPYTIFFQQAFPQSRGGKNLNVTLVTESPQEQARILNQPDLYPNFLSSGPTSNKGSPLNISPPLRRFNNDEKRTPTVTKSVPGNAENTPFSTPIGNPVQKNKDSATIPPVATREPEVPNIKVRQNKAVGYPVPPQISKSIYIVSAYDAQNNFRNGNYRYRIPPQFFQTTTSEDTTTPPTPPDSGRSWPCFCVPYYLCKNGVINSGGRSVAAVSRKTRSLNYNFTKKAYTPALVQPKVMNTYGVEQESDPTQCESNKVCCRLSFADGERDNTDNFYPVATPRPEPFYPVPPRFPDNSVVYDQCGVRRAYGIQTRLSPIQYPPDVSEFGEYPWQAALLRKVEGQKSLYLCGGVLLSSKWIATAAHCVKKEQFSPLLIRLGEWDVNRKDELYPFIENEVDSVVLYPDFNPDTLYNDIALIRMKPPVDARLPHITPACLPKRGQVFEEQKCWVSGWGKDFFGPQGEYQNVLKEVDVPVLPREACNTQLRNTNLGPDFTLHPGFICAGGEAGKDACTGDGGSPLVCVNGQTWYVVGLVSWGVGCGQPGVPGIYVNMLYYIDWINSIIWR